MKIVLATLIVEVGVILPLLLVLLRAYAKRKHKETLARYRRVHDHLGVQDGDEKDLGVQVDQAMLWLSQQFIDDGSTDLFDWLNPLSTLRALGRIRACNETLYAIEYKHSAWPDLLGGSY